MKVKMIFAHEIREGGAKKTYRPGESHDLEDDTAKALIKEGKAEPHRGKADAPPSAAP